MYKNPILFILAFFSLILFTIGCTIQKKNNQNALTDIQIKKHFLWVKEQLHHPENGKILFSAHRGDWRHSPENSIQALKNSIEKGYDIVELDLGKTKDGHLVIMHDKTIDRTTTGKGYLENYTLSELKKFKLTHSTGHSSFHSIPTLEEFLIAAKGKIVLCIDKGFDYYEQSINLIKKYKMLDQIIYNMPVATYDSLRLRYLKESKDTVIFNVLSFPTDIAKAERISISYQNHPVAIMHPIFNSDTLQFIKWMPTIKRLGLHLWLNALWPEHCGGHDDDKAVEGKQPDETWGWLINNGATIIQTDRPEKLRDYLLSKKLRPRY